MQKVALKKNCFIYFSKIFKSKLVCVIDAGKYWNYWAYVMQGASQPPDFARLTF